MPAPTPAAAVPYAPAAPPSQPYTPTQNYPNYNQLQQPPVPAPVADPNQFAVAPAPPQQQMQTPVYQPNQYSAPAAPPVAEPPAVPAIEQEVPSNNNLLTVDTSAPTKNPADSMMSKLVNIDDINSPVGGEDSLVGMFSKPIESSPNKGPQPTLAEMKSTKPVSHASLVIFHIIMVCLFAFLFNLTEKN